ncbi:MAG TPA: DoxX family protein [Leptospiraceae bacterium]|jgi:putative oxidoreductase|nr:DoxX family protein [Leptospiraceae bacterium]HNJ32722.1 DoxX family protein [Leptospiraceae bacterium]
MTIASIFSTPEDIALTVLRVTLAVVILPHGLQKLVGAFGGYGFKGTMGYLTGTVGLPSVIAFLVIFIESFGAAGVLLGVGTRVAALGVAAVMLGAAWTAHRGNGFFMNWTGAQKGEGFEFHILAIGLAIVLILRGGGAFSVDQILARLF